MHLLALLEQNGLIDASKSKQVEDRAIQNASSYEEALVAEGITADAIRGAIGTYFNLPAHPLTDTDVISQDVLKYLPEESARHYKIIPLSVTDGILEVGITDPENLAARDALNFISAKHQIPYRLSVILESDLERGLISYETLTGEVDEMVGRFEESITFNPGEEERKKAEVDAEDLDHMKEDAPVTKIVATILRYAVDGKASDIHIEPHESKVVVRFRVDGVLQNSLELPIRVLPALVARTKILTSLRLDEKRKPQDGRFSAMIDNRKIDFRVSILPTSHGEKVVMRILDTEAGVKTLESTGVSPHNITVIRKAIQQPHGIILISGPTGSGKSTTLYALLSEVDRVGKNVISLEDPVEYNMDGVSQSQVRPEIGYTFANGLRSALRQDPDVIMVGEIRDKETAQLAIQAALTGHLVLSTIHTNNAAGVVPRLIDMGVDPYLIAPTLCLAIAQRLVRRICPGTGRKVKMEGSVKTWFDEEFRDLPEKYLDMIPKSDYILGVDPTPQCTSGTKGRVAVMETIEVGGPIEKLILKGASEDEIFMAAKAQGFISMKGDAMIKALNHMIPFEEISTLGGDMLASDEAEKEAKGAPVDNPERVTL